MLSAYIRFFLENKLVAWLLLMVFIAWGLATSPFDFGIEALPRDPVSVDAIPNIGENQQIIFTTWAGRSPQDVEDQVTYPLTTALLGIPGVKSIRSNSMFGFSSIYLIFEENVEFYWSRSRILEKLNALPPNTLPMGIQPTLGPDATALGQIFWYTLEGRDKEGNPTGGWDLQELRTIQDYYVRYGLSAAEGVAEVASIGGYMKEYQVDVDPEAMKVNNISLEEIMLAIKNSNLEIGAQTIEINLAEYFVRGLGYIQQIEDIEESVVKVNKNVPLRIGDVARVSLGPANRRGVLDKSGAEAVGGVVVARYGANPMEVIQKVKEKIAEIQPGLASKTLADGTVSQVQIIPFYDRTQLINETIGTLREALTLEVLITVIVVILMLLNLESSLLVSGSLPVAVLMCFIAMRYFGVEANIVALSGIAIAVGTMVDMGIVLTESMVKRMKEAPPDEDLLTTIFEATIEVSSAVITAVATTIISFIPVFTMEAAEGKLFRPLAFTKTFALLASIIIAISIIPPLAHRLFSWKSRSKVIHWISNSLAILGGLLITFLYQEFIGNILIVAGFFGMLRLILQSYDAQRNTTLLSWISNIVYALIVIWLLASVWMPLGVIKSNWLNFWFVLIIAGSLIGLFYLVIYFYEQILRFLLQFKLLFLALVGFMVYQGFVVYRTIGEEFMPSLDEGSFLLMPTTMPHAGMQENIKNLRLLDMAVTAIPEVETVVGKAGRVSSALDPAPMSMYENVILYKSEYKTDDQGLRLRFKHEDGEYLRNENEELIPDKEGRYFRQWREHIKSPDDIWQEIVKVTKLPGVTSAPKLQPIETRLVMLQTGMRAPMGIKVQGTDLEAIEAFGLKLEDHLKAVKGVKDATVFADRIVGKPYLIMDIDRRAIARFGLTINQVQQYIQAAVGGMTMTTTVEGRERYAVRIRYPRELRNDPQELKRIYISIANGQQIPLGDLVDIRYEQGAQSIKSEDGFLVGYVLFDREDGFSEVEVVNNAQTHVKQAITNGNLVVPAGISYRFAGNYEQQQRANKRLSIVVPLALAIIFLILYFQFKSFIISAMVFTGVFIAFAGGFIMIGLYDTSWFLNFELFGTNFRDLFQIQSINLSVAVWVGFLALFGIATDDGVLVATFLKNSFKRKQPKTIEGIREAVVEGGKRRVRPAMMTTATTILALMPLLTSTGRGSDIMIPMAIPTFGGMSLQIITMFTVPVLYSLWQEWKLRMDRGILGKSNVFGGLSIVLLIAIFSPSPTQAQPLDTLVKTALENNLDLKVLHNQYLAALEKAPQVNQLPDPELGLGLFPLPVETRLGAQVFRLSATQQFPWFGTLKQKESVELARAKALFEKIEAQALGLELELKQAYYQLYETERSKAILQRNVANLEALEQFALAKIEAGQATAADALRIQLKIEALQQEIKILQRQSQKPVAKINQLLNQPMDFPIQVRDSLSFAIVLVDKETLRETIANNHPMINILDLKEETSRQVLKLNSLNAKPSFGVGLDYTMVDRRSDAFPLDNGRDILQMRASVRIPFNRNKYSAKEREEAFNLAALSNQKAALLNRFLTTIEMAYSDYETAQLQLELYDRQINLTQAAIEVLSANYSSKGDGFDDLLQLEMDLIDYDLKQLKAVVESHRAKSRIDFLIL